MKKCSEQRPIIYVLATGGTIAGRGNSPLQTGNYRAGELSVAELTASVPGLSDLAEIKGEQICNVASPFVTVDIWLTIARRINEIYANEPEVTGIVVTHGTDSLEETAYFLNLVVDSRKPVVVVGSMRPATALSPDGPLNLVSAINVAADPQAIDQGVLVVMNDEIYTARDVSKTHVSYLHTFRSPDLGALGSVSSGTASFYRRALRRHTKDSEFTVTQLATLPRVDIIYAHLGADGALIEAAVASGARGIVLASMGQGGGTHQQNEALQQAQSQGVIIVRSSRTGSGRMLPTNQARLEQGGSITADNLNPQKARILLMLALTQTTDKYKIQDFFTKY